MDLVTLKHQLEKYFPRNDDMSTVLERAQTAMSLATRANERLAVEYAEVVHIGGGVYGLAPAQLTDAYQTHLDSTAALSVQDFGTNFCSFVKLKTRGNHFLD